MSHNGTFFQITAIVISILNLFQLKLDVEDFISPNESASNSSKLKKCESMDFKDLSSVKKDHVAKENTVTSGLRAALLKKLPEAFNRKYFSGSVKKEDAERVKAAVIGSGTRSGH